jgi:hypothetical protein
MRTLVQHLQAQRLGEHAQAPRVAELDLDRPEGQPWLIAAKPGHLFSALQQAKQARDLRIA